MKKGEDGYYPYMCGQLMNCLATLLEHTAGYKPKDRMKRQYIKNSRKMATKLLSELEN